MINEEQLLPTGTATRYDVELRLFLVDILRKIIRELNRIAGLVAVASADAEPTQPGGIGDFVKNIDRTPQGGAGYEYVLDGWEYTTDGWRERRLLTGN